MTDIAGTPAVSEQLATPATLTATPPIEQRRGRRGGVLGFAGWVSIVWLAFVFLGAIFADVLPLKDPDTFDVLNVNQTPNQPIGTPGFPLGTDANSWDILSRLIYGGRVSLIVAFGVLAIGMVIGGGIGLVAGFLRGRSETLLMAVVDIFLAFPALILLIAIVAFLGSDLKNVVVGISLVSIPAFARISRATTLTFSRREFVLAAEAAGASKRRILVREVLPNVILPLMAFGLLVVGIAIVAEGSLAFLGLSAADTISWGGMIDDSRRGLQQENIAHPALLPALWMFLTVLSVNFLGDRFRAAFDVKDAAL
jgi:peptide/nickel transport system permease protein